MTPIPDPRPLLATGLAFLALGFAWSLADHYAGPLPLADAAAWFLIAGWLFPSWLATALWYHAPFVKRAPLVPAARFGIVALVALALLTLPATALAPGRMDFAGAFPRLLAIGLLAASALLAAGALAGPPWRGGMPAWRKPGAHRAGDALAAAAAAGAVLHLALTGGVLLAEPVRGPGAPALTLLLVGFAAQGYAAFALHLLPRNAKAPFGRVAAATGAGALVAGNAGLLLVAWALLRPVTAPPLAWGGSLVAVAFLALGAFLAATPFRAPGTPGRLLAKARAWLVASGVTFAAAGAAALVVTARVETLAPLLPGILRLALGATALAHVGVALLAWPVALNAVPRGAEWSGLGAATGLASALFVVTGALAPGVYGAGLILGAVAALLHVAQIAPLRSPRRACPPA